MLLALFASVLAFSQITTGLERFDDHTLASFEKYQQNEAMRAEFDHNYELAVASSRLREYGQYQVWESVPGGTRSVTYTKADEKNFYRIRNNQFSNDNRIAKNIGSLAADEVVNLIPYSGYALKVMDIFSQDQARINGISLIDFSRKQNFIREEAAQNRLLAKNLQNKESQLSETELKNSALVTTRQVVQSELSRNGDRIIADSLQKKADERLVQNTEATDQVNTLKAQKQAYEEKLKEIEERILFGRNVGELLSHSSSDSLREAGRYVSGLAELEGVYQKIKLGMANNMSTLAMTNLYLMGANIAMNLLSGAKESGTAKALKAIMEAIANLRKEMHARFDAIERTLKNMGYKLDDIRTLQNLTLYKLHQVVAMLDNKDRNDIFRSENAEMDQNKIRTTFNTCDNYLRKQGYITSSVIADIEVKCFQKIVQILLETSSADSISPRATSLLRSRFYNDEFELVRQISMTNPHGTLNLLLYYIDEFLVGQNHALRNDINRNYGASVFETIHGEMSTYPNVKLFLTFMDVFNKIKTSYGQQIEDIRNYLDASKARVVDETTDTAKVYNEANNLSKAIRFMNERGARIVTERLLNLIVEDAQSFLLTVKSHYLEKRYFVNIDTNKDEERFKSSFYSHKGSLRLGSSHLFVRELQRMQALQARDQKYLESNPWPVGMFESNDINAVTGRIHYDIPHDKQLRTGFQYYIGTLINAWSAKFNHKFNISLVSISANPEKVLQDYIDGGCVPGVSPGTKAHTKLNPRGNNPMYAGGAPGWCTIAERSVPTNGYYLKFKLKGNAQPEQEFYVTINPQVIIFDGRNSTKDYVIAKTRSNIEASMEQIIAATNKGLAYAAMQARQEYMSMLNKILKNEWVFGKITAEDKCANIKVFPDSMSEDVGKKLCSNLLSKNRYLDVILDIVSLYNIEQLMAVNGSKGFEALVRASQNTNINAQDINNIMMIFTSPLSQVRGGKPFRQSVESK